MGKKEVNYKFNDEDVERLVRSINQNRGINIDVPHTHLNIELCIHQRCTHQRAMKLRNKTK